jgi:hypothetical protein
MIHGVAGGNGMKVDVGFLQRLADAREGAGPVFQKQG